jgi:MFS family permease
MESATSQPVIALKWKEIYSLSALSAAVAFSWIAYHEYQPHLLQKFEFQELGLFLVITKAIVLVVVPPLAGWLSDALMRKTGKFMMVFSVGIGVTAMAFMVVATIIGAGPLSQIKWLLPYLIVIWLIAMNIFTSPALTMLEGFAPAQKLPVAVAFLFFATQMIYSLEPVLIELILFLGYTLTFIGGGILIAGLGYLFHKVSSDEVSERRKMILQQETAPISFNTIVAIVFVGLVFGTGNAFLVEYIPSKASDLYSETSSFGNYLSFGLLGLAAIVALTLGGYVSKSGPNKFLSRSIQFVAAGLLIVILGNSPTVFLVGSILLALAFGLMSTCALPFALNNLSLLHLGLGVGAFIGASYVVEGILEQLFY